MDILSNYLDDSSIADVLKIVPDLKMMDDVILSQEVDILKKYSCTDETISEAIYANPQFLEQSSERIERLVSYLFSIGIEDIDEIVSRNPWILSKGVEEISSFLENQNRDGIKIEEAIEKLIIGEQF